VLGLTERGEGDKRGKDCCFEGGFAWADQKGPSSPVPLLPRREERENPSQRGAEMCRNPAAPRALCLPKCATWLKEKPMKSALGPVRAWQLAISC